MIGVRGSRPRRARRSARCATSTGPAAPTCSRSSAGRAATSTSRSSGPSSGSSRRGAARSWPTPTRSTSPALDQVRPPAPARPPRPRRATRRRPAVLAAAADGGRRPAVGPATRATSGDAPPPGRRARRGLIRAPRDRHRHPLPGDGRRPARAPASPAASRSRGSPPSGSTTCAPGASAATGASTTRPTAAGPGWSSVRSPWRAPWRRCAAPTRSSSCSIPPASHSARPARSASPRSTHLVLLCPRYEGVDERIRALVDLELSIGDYVLTGGELPALVVVDAVLRLLPGAIEAASLEDESFTRGLLEYPQYTRPAVFEGRGVPDDPGLGRPRRGAPLAASRVDPAHPRAPAGPPRGARLERGGGAPPRRRPRGARRPPARAGYGARRRRRLMGAKAVLYSAVGRAPTTASPRPRRGTRNHPAAPRERRGLP